MDHKLIAIQTEDQAFADIERHAVDMMRVGTGGIKTELDEQIAKKACLLAVGAYLARQAILNESNAGGNEP